MTTPIRVLVVDDSVVIRRIVVEALSKDPQIEIVGTAANGRIALAMIDKLHPDVVSLDIEMPEMDGITCVGEIRKKAPFLPVIMFSTLTAQGASATLEALTRGASDYVTKPSNTGGAEESRQRIRDELIPKIKELAKRNRAGEAKLPLADFKASKPPLRSSVLAARGASLELVVVGVSTGGPNALMEVIPELPADFPVPIVVVQHMPALFTRLLADRLDAKSKLQVREASDGTVLSAGGVWIAPGDLHTVVARDRMRILLHTHHDPRENSCRPSADVLFRSAAMTCSARCLAVVMTGMGQDGLRGCELIHEKGGSIVVQDKATSIVWGMPGYVADAGLAERVLPLKGLAPEITRRARLNRARDAGRPDPSKTTGAPSGT